MLCPQLSPKPSAWRTPTLAMVGRGETVLSHFDPLYLAHDCEQTAFQPLQHRFRSDRCRLNVPQKARRGSFAPCVAA